ncbi:3'-5' exonuclease [Escherichia coli]|uniref:DNA 3'-5' helicase n=1 Tax=Escherichia coli TaxID=562 RepID=A0AAW4F3V7_ECOLX|nr:nuclease-related domain-containing DEAD/DEAH box helicase [Escherichia coli]ELP2947611.1 NERD domain-containing protein [Escherichia coli O76]ELT1935189.1 NERD domain-containing protein [Shigella sonnei]HDQ6521731.1 NERD domain-containing protein [Escherichia coli O113:H4]HDQ6665453.1 NERD domain-containing protein [Escherichia coli O166:H28]HDQ6865772.1 NERD domain-containing protein [Escherichia coli O176:H4]
MTAGEKRVASRLEAFMSNECLVWYDIPVGRKNRHPDFVIIDPENGLVFLEVKDWTVHTLHQVNHEQVILETNGILKSEINPLVQVRRYACDTVNALPADSRLRQNDGQYKGRLNLAWAYGVVFTRITRQQLKALAGNDENAVERIFPSAQTICQDDMTQSVLPDIFRQKIAGMFTMGFRTRVTPQVRDILRAHLFPEMTVRQHSQIKIMDIQQEILARNIGDGHRVIHGVAGSGKTMILLFRCLYLAETTPGKILVLCYNITLASYLRECIESRGLKSRVTVFHFHSWCASMIKRHGIQVTAGGKDYPEKCFSALEDAVNSGTITDTGYDAVLVDEGHDFESRWLALIARLFDNASRSLLLMYDDAQSIYRRERALNFSLASVGIQAQGRTSVLPVNYRNTKRILHFAYAFSREYFEKHQNREIPFVQPQAGGEEGTEPEILRCASESDEAVQVVGWLEKRYTLCGHWSDMAVLCPAEFSVKHLKEVMTQRGIPYATCFDSEGKKKYSRRKDVVHLLTYQSSKGLEFPYVAVINASFVHSGAADESEVIPALYVAFTRATRELLVTCYRENSISRHLEDFV